MLLQIILDGAFSSAFRQHMEKATDDVSPSVSHSNPVVEPIAINKKITDASSSSEPKEAKSERSRTEDVMVNQEVDFSSLQLSNEILSGIRYA